jgi:CRISPR-associated protein Cas2
VLSGYRLMWLLVMFDLPVVLKEERDEATRFRLRLLDLGFERSQLSVYMRFCTSQSHIDAVCRKVEAALPPGGKVNILIFTDKQYERIVTYHGGRRQAPSKTPDQFDLF